MSSNNPRSNQVGLLVVLSLAATAWPSPLTTDQAPIRQRDSATPVSFVTNELEDIILSATINDPALFTIDHGHNVEGIPAFEVIDVKGSPLILEISYAESRDALDHYMVCTT
jgi:hypothetical protein